MQVLLTLLGVGVVIGVLVALGVIQVEHKDGVSVARVNWNS